MRPDKCLLLSWNLFFVLCNGEDVREIVCYFLTNFNLLEHVGNKDMVSFHHWPFKQFQTMYSKLIIKFNFFRIKFYTVHKFSITLLLFF